MIFSERTIHEIVFQKLDTISNLVKSKWQQLQARPYWKFYTTINLAMQKPRVKSSQAATIAREREDNGRCVIAAFSPQRHSANES